MRNEFADESTATLNPSPSFLHPPSGDGWSFADSPQQITAAPVAAAEADDDIDGHEAELDFAFAVQDPDTDPPITADEIFSDGQIRPFYPAFSHGLFLPDRGEEESARRQPLLQLLNEDRDWLTAAALSPSADELDGIPPGTYCVWKPGSAAHSLGLVSKSRSTGSSFRWRIRNLVVPRSHSDGKEKFVFLAATEEKRPPVKEKGLPVMAGKAQAEGVKKKGKGKKATEMDLITAHRIFYGQRDNGAAAKGGATAGRKSFLPYKQKLWGS